MKNKNENKETKKKNGKNKRNVGSFHFLNFAYVVCVSVSVLCLHTDREHNDTRILPSDYVCLPATAAKS